MARVVVLGGGLAGMASAARLAKLGHSVTLVEAADRLGGALAPVEQDGFRWDGGAHATLLPAVLRDLFRKTGRPIERELDLVALDPVREHRFADGSRLRLPGGSRAAQIAAVEGLGTGLGRVWADFVSSYADDWDLLRRDFFERPYDPATADPAATRVLRGRRSLRDDVARRLPDERLRLVALHHVRSAGHDPARTPSWLGVTSYLEQRLGAATVAGGFSVLGDALASRLRTRGVEVLLSAPVRRLRVERGRVHAVVTPEGELGAEVVVVATDPRGLPELSRGARGAAPTTPPSLTHLGLAGDLDLAHETVLHGEPDLAVHRGGSAPGGHCVLTVLSHRPVGDPVATLAERGVDVRDRVVTRVDRSPADLLAASGGSPYGVAWDGRSTVRRRLGPRTPVAGLYLAGAHANPGAGVPFVGLSAAQVAQLVGPA